MLAGDRTTTTATSGGVGAGAAGTSGGWWSVETTNDGAAGGGGVGGSSSLRSMESEFICRHHHHNPRENQCSSTLNKQFKAPIHRVWSLVRRFDKPQKYKPFVSRCVVRGDLEIGSVREVNVKSGLSATTSTERLELLDDNKHILSIKIVGGNHRLKGHLHTYRFCDNVWTFILQDATFKNEESQDTVGRVKIVACDSKLLSQ